MDSALLEYSVAKLEQTRANPITACKVCGADSVPFDLLDFNKSCGGFLHGPAAATPVVYRRCRDCDFIFTDYFDDFTAEMWREYVYNHHYEKVDPDYKIVRPRDNARVIRAYLFGRKRTTIGLDYGGGNGTTSILLREEGWRFDSYDPFGHTMMDPAVVGRYNFSSAIEVFEHSPDPVGTLRDILSRMSPERMMILITTLPTDGAVSDQSGLAWWYAAPRNGHVSLYSRRSLEKLASHFSLQFLSIGKGPHFLFRGYQPNEMTRLILRGKLLWRLHRLNQLVSRRLIRGKKNWRVEED